MCLASSDPDGTSGRSGVNREKFSASTSVTSTPPRRPKCRSSRTAAVTPANPPPRITTRFVPSIGSSLRPGGRASPGGQGLEHVAHLQPVSVGLAHLGEVERRRSQLVWGLWPDRSRDHP